MAGNNPGGNTDKRILDRVSFRIHDKLLGLPQVPPEKSIFKVHNQLRMVNERAYEPEFVAIGPYHHYNDRLHYMEEQKWHYLQQMLRRRKETAVDTYVLALGEIEVDVRQQYAGIITLGQEDFIEMMLVDGCFIIEYLRNYMLMVTRGENDSLLSVDWVRLGIRRDLLLLENQLPFIVLTTLYDLIKDDERFVVPPDLIFLAQISLNPDDLWLQTNHCRHLLDLVYQVMISGVSKRAQSEDTTMRTGIKCEHLLDLVYQVMISNVSQRAPFEDPTMRTGIKCRFTSSATELKGSGINFKSVDKSDVLDIQFNKGTLEIPTIIVEDDTEAFLRNLVAYEQHCQDKNYVSDYLRFIDCLVNTPEDVRLLRQKGVIHNYLGDDEVVSTMFNKIGDYIILSNSYYASIFEELDRHCRKRRNRWMAILTRDYFHSPWALISVLAAIMLLLLTLTQTVYTVISFYKGI